MSKNTERGIGLQGGPADGQAGPSATGGGDLPKPVETPRMDRTASEPQRAPVADSRLVTLLGVPSPLADREKVTALGRDVHLPVEAHRMATSRPIAISEAAPGPVTARGSGVQPPKQSIPETPKPEFAQPQPAPAKVETEVALEVRSPDAGKPRSGVPERPQPARPTNPADRATFDASPLVVGEESSEETALPSDAKGWLRPALRPSIGLGIGMALVLSIVLVSIVRFTALDEGEEEPLLEESAGGHHPSPPPKVMADQDQLPLANPALEPTKAAATGGTPADAARTTADTAAANDDKPEELPSSSPPPDKETLGKDTHRPPPRTRVGVVGPKRTPTGDSAGEAATGGAGSGVTAPTTPPKSGAPNQPYDPDSPLPPAGE